MNEVVTIGDALAKNVFQVHGVDAEGYCQRTLPFDHILSFS